VNKGSGRKHSLGPDPGSPVHRRRSECKSPSCEPPERSRDRDLKAGIVDEHLVAALRSVTEEHRICVDTFKEGHYFLPGIPDGPLVPDGYSEAGVLFRRYTRSSTEVSHRTDRGDSQSRASINVDVKFAQLLLDGG
jgi:hypothetical protein